MNKLIKMCVAAAMGATVAGCGKQRYEDPQAFMEGPGNEALCKWHEAGMNLCGFSGFKFKNAKVEMDLGREMACADFMLVPKKGQKFYRLINLKFDDRGLLRNPTNANEWCDGFMGIEISRLKGKGFDADVEEIRPLLNKVERNEFRPVFYGPEIKGAALEEVLNTGYRVRIPRLKDSEGIYRVVEDRNLVDYVGNGPDNWRPNSRGDNIGDIICKEVIEQCKLLDIASAEAKIAISNYVNGCMNMKAKLPALAKAMLELKELKDGSWTSEKVYQHCEDDPHMRSLANATRKSYTVRWSRNRKDVQEQEARIAAARKAAKDAYDNAVADYRKKVEVECAKQAAAKEQDVKTLLREVRKLLGLPETRAADKQG